MPYPARSTTSALTNGRQVTPIRGATCPFASNKLLGTPTSVAGTQSPSVAAARNGATGSAFRFTVPSLDTPAITFPIDGSNVLPIPFLSDLACQYSPRTPSARVSGGVTFQKSWTNKPE